MFTGIIKNLGTVESNTKNTLAIRAKDDLIGKLTLGESIAVNGICLTVTDLKNNLFKVNYIPETASMTTIGDWSNNDLVNLELPATPLTFLSGHIIQGHIDAIGKLEKMEKDHNSHILTISIPSEFMKYIIQKGTIIIDGVALTIVDLEKNKFRVAIIPHTWDYTNFSKINIDDNLNIEFDILGKYILNQKITND